MTRPSTLVDREGWRQLRDAATIRAHCEEVIADAANADMVKKYWGGNTRTFGALVAKVLQRSQGKADPVMANDILTDALVKAKPL